MLKFGTLVGLVLNNNHHQFKNVLWTLWHIGTKFVAIIKSMFGRYLRVWGQCHLAFQRLFTKKTKQKQFLLHSLVYANSDDIYLFYVTLLLCHFEVMKNGYFTTPPNLVHFSAVLAQMIFRPSCTKKNNHYPLQRNTFLESTRSVFVVLSWAKSFSWF